MSLAIELLTRDDLEISSELDTLEAVRRWFTHNSVPQIFTAVRLVSYHGNQSRVTPHALPL